MPGTLGSVGDSLHDAFVQEVQEYEETYREQLTPYFQDGVRYQQMYFALKEDERLPHEEWRSSISSNAPFSSVETAVSAESSILNSIDPPVQAEGVSGEDEISARGIERLIDFRLRRMRWRLKQDAIIRDTAIQGMCWPKLTWKRDASYTRVEITPEQYDHWLHQISQAVMAGAPPPPGDEIEFEAWRQMVEQAGMPPVPAIPQGGVREIIHFNGSWVDLVPNSAMRWDPGIGETDDQECIIQRIVKPRDWILDRAGPEAHKPYDIQQVMEGLMFSAEQNRFTAWEEEVAAMLGIEITPYSHPRSNDWCELWEVWRRGHQYPFAQILNRQAVINKMPDEHPLDHGLYPFFPMRDTPMPGGNMMLGLSMFMPNEGHYEEYDKLMNLRLDALTLAVLPILGRMAGVHMKDADKFWTPGMILDMAHPEGLKQVTMFPAGLAEALRQIAEIRVNIDDAQSTTQAVRGSASGGRVTATEVERRLTQSLDRMKQRVIRHEEELTPMVRMMLMLEYQYGDPEVAVTVSGREIGRNAVMHIQRDRFLSMMEADWKFVGATKATSREMTAQQLRELYQVLMTTQMLLPQEARALAKDLIDLTRGKGGGKYITEQGTQFLVQQWMAAMMAGNQANEDAERDANREREAAAVA